MADRGKKQAIHSTTQQALRENISRQLMAIDDWYELQDVLTQFPQKMAPVIGVCFLISNQLQQDQFITVAERWHKDHLVVKYPKKISGNKKQIFSFPLLHRISAKQYVGLPNIDKQHSYCLPFIISGTPIGLLHLHFSDSRQLTTAEKDHFNELSPTIALAIDTLLPEIYEGNKELDVRRFAQYLHDTVGQSLGYLLLKLNVLHSEVGGKTEIHQQEILEIQQIANEAYEQVRDILTAMQPSLIHELSSSLYKMAIQTTGRLPNVQVKMICEGKAHQLSTNIFNIIMAIFREAVLNIVKHANADNIELNILWQEDSLTIDLHDDGQGFSSEEGTGSSYGMQIMLELASEINARLMVESGQGTTISLHLAL